MGRGPFTKMNNDEFEYRDNDPVTISKPLTKDQQAKIKALICEWSKIEKNENKEFSFYCEHLRTYQYKNCLKCAAIKFILRSMNDGE